MQGTVVARASTAAIAGIIRCCGLSILGLLSMGVLLFSSSFSSHFGLNSCFHSTDHLLALVKLSEWLSYGIMAKRWELSHRIDLL